MRHQLNKWNKSRYPGFPAARVVCIKKSMYVDDKSQDCRGYPRLKPGPAAGWPILICKTQEYSRIKEVPSGHHKRGWSRDPMTHHSYCPGDFNIKKVHSRKINNADIRNGAVLIIDGKGDIMKTEKPALDLLP
jgi:hypothetical protein